MSGLNLWIKAQKAKPLLKLPLKLVIFTPCNKTDKRIRCKISNLFAELRIELAKTKIN